MSVEKRKITAVILAHVDSGKTTLSEAMLYCCGEIRTRGRVDHGDAFLDTHGIEKERGITVFAKQAVLHTAECEITLLDTPGHVDFSGETERSLYASDMAVLVISGTDGVQSHTKVLNKLLDNYRLPTFIFVNKMDMSGTDKAARLRELNEEIGNCIDFSYPFQGDFRENVAACDEELLDEYLDTGSLSDDSISRAISRRMLFPCIFGSALKNEGVEELISCIDRFSPKIEYGDDFGARVFKISDDGAGNRLTHMKITGGVLKARDTLSLQSGGEAVEEKVSQIRIYSGKKFTPVNQAASGTVCAALGLKHSFAGQGLGAENDAPLPLLEPTVSCGVIIEDGTDIDTALISLKALEQEEPRLQITLDEQNRQIRMQCMGEIQQEVLIKLAHDRFGLNISFGESRPAYRETIKSTVIGIGHYEPLRHYAEVHLLLEPLERGSGLVFESDCPEGMLDKSFERAIISQLKAKQHIGVLTGSPITDMKITLIAGRSHPKHTEGGDFREAAYRALRQGLRSAECILLEPQYDFSLKIPTECVGRAVTDIQLMHGEFSPPEIWEEYAVIKGNAPAVLLGEYQKSVSAYTSGRGSLVCRAGKYAECADSERVIAEIGYDADSDLANSADSIFCANGAGYTVKWNEVESCAHVSSERSTAQKQKGSENYTAHTAYTGSFYNDEELMAIFERTYGKINRDKRTALYTPKEMDYQPKIKAKPVPKGDEHIFVDGYNMIFAWDELKSSAAKNLDLARSQLVNRLCSYQGFRQCVLTLVFDGYRVKGGVGSEEYPHNITVIYTKEGETADTYIQKAVYELADKNKDYRIRVASSDNLEQLMVSGSGAVRISAEEFHSEVAAVERAIHEVTG